MGEQHLYAVPIKDRPRISVLHRFRTLGFAIAFFAPCIIIHLFQLLIALPFHLIPHPAAQRTYRSLISFSKDAFSTLLVALTAQGSFGPTKFLLTADDSIDLNGLCILDDDGNVIGFNFEQHSLWISNHQQYADWIYCWILFAMGGISSGLCIILKASLEWTPILGPAMQFFQFAFVSKSKPLQRVGGICTTARQAVQDGSPFSLLLFPEGTLVSPLTRPKSAAYAVTSGVADLDNLLLPRSTGFLYSLRTLSTVMPDLALYDLTIGYPGVPDRGYAQNYYTLQSLYGAGVTPPAVHLHLRRIPIKSIPLGQGLPSPSTMLNSAKVDPKAVDEILTIDERVKFQEWTYSLYAEKDQLMAQFYKTGRFPRGKQDEVEVQPRMRRGDLVYAVIPLSLWAIGKGALSVLSWMRG